MKKVFFVLFVFAAMTTASFAQGTTDSTVLNLSMTLDKYIETMPGPVSWNIGTTGYTNAWGPAREFVYSPLGQWNLAYANCPFRVSITGDNPAGEGKPRFARQEVGPHANGFDTLPTLYAINFTTNGVRDLFYGTWLQGAHQFPYSKDYTEAPHNGQVFLDISVFVNDTVASEAIPVRAIAINPAFTWQQSADAGVYTAQLTITLTAI
jgi:hypothetical protein